MWTSPWRIKVGTQNQLCLLPEPALPPYSRAYEWGNLRTYDILEQSESRCCEKDGRFDWDKKDPLRFCEERELGVITRVQYYSITARTAFAYYSSVRKPTLWSLKLLKSQTITTAISSISATAYTRRTPAQIDERNTKVVLGLFAWESISCYLVRPETKLTID